MARRKARELAFRALFQAERGGQPVEEVWLQVRSDIADDLGEEEAAYGDVLDTEGLAFAARLVDAYAQNSEAVDAELEEVLEGWTFRQMAQTDLNLLRLALTEMRYLDEAPPEVTIEMAVRLAKKFGGEDSGRFVNGVLGKLYRNAAATSGA
jgi:N utilization substance protein B